MQLAEGSSARCQHMGSPAAAGPSQRRTAPSGTPGTCATAPCSWLPRRLGCAGKPGTRAQAAAAAGSAGQPVGGSSGARHGAAEARTGQLGAGEWADAPVAAVGPTPVRHEHLMLTFLHSPKWSNGKMPFSGGREPAPRAPPNALMALRQLFERLCGQWGVITSLRLTERDGVPDREYNSPI
jgi:hypothetical protein